MLSFTRLRHVSLTVSGDTDELQERLATGGPPFHDDPSTPGPT